MNCSFLKKFRIYLGANIQEFDDIRKPQHCCVGAKVRKVRECAHCPALIEYNRIVVNYPVVMG